MAAEDLTHAAVARFGPSASRAYSARTRYDLLI
jgi:hypothetical protein